MRKPRLFFSYNATFGKRVGVAEWRGRASLEHFMMDGVLIGAWASIKRSRRRTDQACEDGGRVQPDDGFQVSLIDKGLAKGHIIPPTIQARGS